MNFRGCQLGRLPVIQRAMAENIQEKVTEIIVEQLGVTADQVKPESKMIEDLGADSLDAVELVMAVEEEFGIEVPDEEAEKLISVGDIISHVEKAQADRKSVV